jgi:hypothetical protein
LRPVPKPNLVDFAYQARVHPNPFSSKLRTSPSPGIAPALLGALR